MTAPDYKTDQVAQGYTDTSTPQARFLLTAASGVACPTCHALPHYRCRNLDVAPVRAFTEQPHPRRVEAAQGVAR